MATLAPTPDDKRNQSMLSIEIDAILSAAQGSEVVIDDMVIDRSNFELYGIHGRRWPNNHIIYSFDNGVTEDNQSRFRDAVLFWEVHSGLTFTERPNAADRILVEDSNENSSYLGFKGGVQKLKMFNWGRQMTIVHELGHAIGFIHEHQRPDRDSHVCINWDNIDDENHPQFQTVSGADTRTLYSAKSFMHYSATAFSNNGQNTIDPCGAPRRWWEESPVALVGNRFYADHTASAAIDKYFPQETGEVRSMPMLLYWKDTRPIPFDVVGPISDSRSAGRFILLRHGNWEGSDWPKDIRVTLGGDDSVVSQCRIFARHVPKYQPPLPPFPNLWKNDLTPRHFEFESESSPDGPVLSIERARVRELYMLFLIYSPDRTLRDVRVLFQYD